MVKFVLKRDKAGVFHFTPLQSATGERLLRQHDLPGDLRSTMVLIADGDGEPALIRGDAVAAILRRLPGVWRPLGAVYGILPRPIRDGLYRFIARIRFRLFGKSRSACPNVPQHLAERFHA